MTREKLKQAQQDQTPLVWSPSQGPELGRQEVVTVYTNIHAPGGVISSDGPLSRVWVVRCKTGGCQRVLFVDLRPATAQDLLELGDTT